MSQKLTSQPPPLALSMVLADHVHRDPASGKYFILGTYNTLLAPSFPRVCQPLVVYAALTDGHGRMPLRLVLTDADEELGAIYYAEGAAQADDPTRVWEVVFLLRGVVLPRPGQYRLQLFSGASLLRELRLEARQTGVGVASGGTPAPE